MKFKVLLLFIVGLSVSKSQHVSLVGSHILPTNADYKVYLAAHDLTEDSVINVTLQSDPNNVISKVFERVSGDLSQEIDFKLPENRPSSYRLNIVHRNKATNACMRQSATVEDSFRHHLIFIHHDKPVYKNGEIMRFRTFVLDHNMLPYRYTSMNVSILDGRKNVIRIFKNVQTTNYGVFEGSVQVAESPNLGVWRIQVDVDGKTRSKHFPVKYQEENRFEVVVSSMEKEVPFEDEYIFLEIQAKCSVNKVFNGVAKISSSARLDGKDEPLITRFIRNVTLPLDKNTVNLRIDNDLGIRSPSADMIATLTVEVFEDRTRRYEKTSTDVPLRMYRNRLQLVRNPSFKPGFDFDMTIKAFTLNGEPDKSLRQLTMSVDYEEFHEDTHLPSTKKEVFNLNLKNGEIDVVLHPTPITRSIKLNFDFGGAHMTDRISKMDDNGINEYMQTTIENKKQSYDPTEVLKMKTNSSGTLQTLHVLVIGPTGLLYSKSYKEATGRGVFKFDLQLSAKMSPLAYIFTFYARVEDGVIVSDEQVIRINFTAANLLEVTPKVQAAKPRESVTINLKTAKDSLVFLTAVDQNVTILDRGNEISRALMYQEVVNYINENMNGSSNYDLGRINSFILQPLVSGVPCNAKEMTQLVQEDDEVTLEDKLAQRYFPNVWFDESIEVKTDAVQLVRKQVPNELTSWLIYGVSMHPTKGFAVVQKEASVSVFNEIALKVKTPASMHQGEVLNVEINVFNFLKSSQSVQVTLVVVNGDTMDEKTSNINGKVCRTYTRRNKPTSIFTQQLSANSLSATQNLFVQPTALGEMRIKVTAISPNGAVDEVVRVVKVQERRHLKETNVESYLVDLAGNGAMEKHIMMNLPPNVELVNVYAMFSGNLLGPVLENIELFSNVPMDYREPKTNVFMLSMIVAEYHQARNNKIPNEVMNEMFKGYQETLESLQSEDPRGDNPKSALFHVYATFALIKAKNFMDVDDHEIEKALDYLRTKQVADGSFNDGPDVDMGEGSSYQHILTSQITLAFIKYQKYSNRYDDVITKAMSFLESTKTQLKTDYEKVLVAYTFSAHGDQESSKFLTSSLKCTFANNPDYHDETSLYVGIASFLIELKLTEGEDPRVEVEWLLRHRRPDGSFYSPHDTLSALHALLTYALSRNTNQVNLRVSIDGQNGVISDREQIVRLRLSQNDEYTLNVVGEGLGYATVYYEYETREMTNQTHRNFRVELGRKQLAADLIELTVDVKLVAPGMKSSNLIIVEVEMPSGYEFYGHINGDHIKRVAYRDDRTVAVFYIEQMEANQMYREVIQAVKVYQVEYAAKSIIAVYDYYRPNIRNEFEYDYDLNMMNCRPRGTQTSDDWQPVTTTEKGGFWNFIG